MKRNGNWIILVFFLFALAVVIACGVAAYFYLR